MNCPPAVGATATLPGGIVSPNALLSRNCSGETLGIVGSLARSVVTEFTVTLASLSPSLLA